MTEQPGFLKGLFLNPTEHRLRAGWRIMVMSLFLIASLLIYSPLAIVVLAISMDADVVLFVSTLYSALAFTTAVFAARWLIDRRSLAGLGLFRSRKAWVDLFVGIGIAGLMMALIFILEFLLGWVTFSNSSPESHPTSEIVSGLTVALLTFILVGWSEELLFRGYLLVNFREGLNWVWAMVLSSVIFAVAHAMNPNASWQAMVGLSLSGVFFAYTTLWSRGLWLPIGLHIGWNFFESTVFGFSVSGYDNFSFLQINQSGPESMTGGAFGPEAGLILLPALALGASLVYLYSKKAKRMVL